MITDKHLAWIILIVFAVVTLACIGLETLASGVFVLATITLAIIFWSAVTVTLFWAVKTVIRK